MLQKVRLKEIAVLMLILLSTFYAQEKGTIKGLVADSEFGEPLLGVNVFIEGSNRGAATGLDGKFKIKNLEYGDYTVVFSMIGYTKKVIKGVKLNSNELILNIVLTPESYETEEVVITAKAIMNTDAALLAKRERAIEVSDAISSEQFSKSGGGNAAEAARQIVGATVENGKNVFVRGLGDRYTSTNLNGAQLPSTDPYKRSGSIDIIPTALIDNIQAVKSFTPDRPGNFSGGAVDVNTKDFPENFNFSFSANVNYNSEITFNGSGIGYNGSSTDWLGFDNGMRDIPNIISNETWIANIGKAQTDIKEAKKIDQVTKSFNNEMTHSQNSAPINQSYTLSIGNMFEVAGKQLGLIGSISYKNSNNGYINGILNRWDRGVADKEKNQLDVNMNMRDTKNINEVNLSGLLKTSLKLNDANSVSFNFLFSQNGLRTTRFVSGKYPYDIDPEWNYQARTLLYQSRNLLSYHFSGIHNFKIFNQLKLDWFASFMSSSQDEPDNRFFYNYETDKGEYGVKTNLPPERYFRNSNEDKNDFKINLTIPAKLFSTNSKIKIGGAYKDVNKVFRERRFVYNPVTNIGKFLRETNGDINSLFSNEYLGWTGTDTLGGTYILNRLPLYINETDQSSSNYDGKNNITAFYGMIDIALAKDLRIIAGARYEKTDMKVSSKSEKYEDGKIVTEDILPSLNIVYSPFPKMNFRFSYGKTLSRPGFREIAPFQNYEFNGGDVYVGNTNLKRTLIDNVDLRWEWFLNPGEVLSASLFGKRFNDPIETKIVDGPNKVLSWTNVDEAIVYGLELEARTSLDIISNAANHFKIGGNFSLIHSEVDRAPSELESLRVYESDIDSKREFQGQAPYIINVFLDYENTNHNLNAGIYFNISGKRLSAVGSLGSPDVYEKPFAMMNFSLSKEVISNFYLKLKAGNILSSKKEKVQEFKGNEYIYSSYNQGRSISIGLSYKI